MQKEGIYGNAHTPHTIQSLGTANKGFDSYVANLINALGEEKAINERAQAQKEEWEEQKKLEENRIDYAKEGRRISNWIANADDTISEPIAATSVEEVNKLREEYNKVNEEKEGKKKELEEALALAEKIKEKGVTDFSGFSPSSLTEAWDSLEKKLDERKTALDEAEATQKQHEQLRKEFANKAKDLDSWLDENIAAVAKQAGGDDYEAQVILPALSLPPPLLPFYPFSPGLIPHALRSLLPSTNAPLATRQEESNWLLLRHSIERLKTHKSVKTRTRNSLLKVSWCACVCVCVSMSVSVCVCVCVCLFLCLLFPQFFGVRLCWVFTLHFSKGLSAKFKGLEASTKEKEKLLSGRIIAQKGSQVSFVNTPLFCLSNPLPYGNFFPFPLSLFCRFRQSN